MVDTGVIEDKPTTDAEKRETAISEPAKQRTWSMPKLKWPREQTDELARAATFAWRLYRQVPPVVQLLGVLGLGALLSIAGSVALDNALGRTCAVVFAPGFALAFGVAAHHWYLSFEKTDTVTDAPPVVDLQRSVQFVDSKLAFALNALGTDRQQQAVIALIQAKTATELSFGTGREPVRQSLRPRIRAGGVPKPQPRESVSIAGLA